MPTPDLTRREWDMLTSVQRGLSNDEIADFYEIKPGTVKQHMVRLFKKLGVRSRFQAALLKIRRPKGV